MAKKEIKTYEIDGHKLICPICKNETFWYKKTLMNTKSASLLGYDWTNKNADNYICSNCGYVYWFFK
jgi:predicted RNA-binding Zn-ribbon protein involved in translation (DUF1610 family)